MGRPPHAHWGIWVLQTVLALIRAGCHTLEVHLVKTASTRDTISKVVDGTNAEPMEYRVPKVTGLVPSTNFEIVSLVEAVLTRCTSRI